MAVEGCSSSESGWTMYIASPMQEDDDAGCSNENDEYDHGFVYSGNTRLKKGGAAKVDHEEESDDSMASDASSGPTLNYHAAASKKDKKDLGSKWSARKNIANKSQEKKRVDSRSKK